MPTDPNSEAQEESIEQSAEQHEGTAHAEAMLSEIEARILGSLMEKQLTTPELYPLTLNSLVLACNQKTSREPVMNLEQGAVKRCLYQLQDRKLVEFEQSSRADKFNQRLTRVLHQNQAEHAIFCIMLLRGPQTVNELWSRTQRMHEFKSPAEVEQLLEKLLTKIRRWLKKCPYSRGSVKNAICICSVASPKMTPDTPSPAQVGPDRVMMN